MAWSLNIPEGNESAKVKYDIVPYTRGKVLDLGCGPWKAFPHFIGVDNFSEWNDGRWKPDVVSDIADLKIFASDSMDAVFSSHVLEHIQDTKKTLKEWFRVIKNGGHLVLYLPSKNLYPNIGDPYANPDHVHDFLPKDIIAVMKEVGGWDLLISEERSDGNEYSFLQVYKKLSHKDKHVHSWSEEKPKKTCGIVRYGGFGDMIQASSVLPGLKRQGFHITFYTTPRGYDILKTDPHVDEFIIQDTDQVPNHELPLFWDAQKKKFDRWVNFSESVEGTFLAMPGRTQHLWNKAARDFMLNRNYLEFMHVLAEVPFKPEPKFYPTEEEKKLAKKRRAQIPGRVILFALSGSSLHKVWNHMDKAIARIMLYSDYHIVTVGDLAAKILEQGWEKEARVHKRSAEWSIRDTLAFAEECDLVMGPETGILNSVSMLDIPKILLLSHSSKENLSRDWVNCISLEPEGCECFPCHMLHYGTQHCNYTKTETNAYADCANKISVEKFWEALMSFEKEKAA